jgi:4a-hydroxytetrahydrobiopterin dehydratase|tara:strand:- start:345 stop:752 length:408 start_codon:yes stop_codon:yes gene_type:complete
VYLYGKYVGSKKSMTDEKTYTVEEIEGYLKNNLPNWYFENGWIRRKYKTSGWKGTLMVINTIGHLAEAAWHHPDISASYAFVIVKLQNHAAKGITQKDFSLAEKIESVVQWNPSTEDNTLEGTPEDPRFKYIKYD